MQLKPSPEKLREIAATGNFKVIPVATEILSDIRTPIEVLRILKNVSAHCYLLESAAAK